MSNPKDLKAKHIISINGIIHLQDAFGVLGLFDEGDVPITVVKSFPLCKTQTVQIHLTDCITLEGAVALREDSVVTDEAFYALRVVQIHAVLADLAAMPQAHKGTLNVVSGVLEGLFNGEEQANGY